MNSEFHPDEIVAVHGDGPNASQIRYTRTDDEGMIWGYIYDPEHDKRHPEMLIHGMLKFGYWTEVVDPRFHNINTDQKHTEVDVFDPRTIEFMTLFHNGKKVLELATSADNQVGIQFRVDGEWDMHPDDMDQLDESEQLDIAPEFYLKVLDLFDQGNSELLDRALRGEFSPLPK